MNNILKVVIIILAILLISTQVYSAIPSRATVTEETDLGKYPDNLSEGIVLGDEQGNVFMFWPNLGQYSNQ